MKAPERTRCSAVQEMAQSSLWRLASYWGLDYLPSGVFNLFVLEVDKNLHMPISPLFTEYQPNLRPFASEKFNLGAFFFPRWILKGLHISDPRVDFIAMAASQREYSKKITRFIQVCERVVGEFIKTKRKKTRCGTYIVLGRSGKSFRLRWFNQLNSNINRLLFGEGGEAPGDARFTVCWYY